MHDTFAGSFFDSQIFWAGLLGWLVAQAIKMGTNLARTGRMDFHYLVSLGGMPSAHSALMSAITTAIGLHSGFGSDIFVLALGVSSIVMFDASTVRRAAGTQARLLNQIVEQIFQKHQLSHKKLLELLGHTRTEVFAGMTLGILTALLCHAVALNLQQP